MGRGAGPAPHRPPSPPDRKNTAPRDLTGTGPQAGSWRRSPAWTTYVPLDHLRAVGPLKCGWTTWFTKYGGPTERKWSKRAGRVTTCETPSHHARQPVGRSRCGTLASPPSARASRLHRPVPGSRRPERAGPPPTTGSRRSRRARLPQHTRRRLERIITAGPASPRPNALNGPSHHTRQTHSDGPNNLPGEEESSSGTSATFTLHAFKATPE